MSCVKVADPSRFAKSSGSARTPIGTRAEAIADLAEVRVHGLLGLVGVAGADRVDDPLMPRGGFLGEGVTVSTSVSTAR